MGERNLRFGDALLFELDFGCVKIGAHFGLAGGGRIVAKFRFRDFTASLGEGGFGLRKLDAIFAVIELSEQLAGLDAFRLRERKRAARRHRQWR